MDSKDLRQRFRESARKAFDCQCACGAFPECLLAKLQKILETHIEPVFFMENLKALAFLPFAFLHSVLQGKPLQLIAVEDIGKWVALAFTQPKSYRKQAIEIAGDALTYAQMQAAYQKVYGKRQASLWLPPFLTWCMGGMGAMFRWFGQAGYQADLQKCRALIKDNISFEQWLATQKNTQSASLS